jgi:3-oxoacyl-[acyl-carrier protein] reductase
VSGAVVVTGAGRGIGAALGRHFLDAGRPVFGIDVAAANATLAERRGYRHFQADVTDEAAVDAAFAAIFAAGPVSAVIANAAVTDIAHRRVADLSYATWRHVLRINVDGAFVTGRAAARGLAAQGGGNIVFVTSSLALLDQALAGDAPYCTSKAAVEMFARVLARELAPARVNVNTLYPSVKIDTGFFAHLDAGERAELARPDILDRSADFLANLPPGTLTGRSLDQQRFDADPHYRAGLEREAMAGTR